VAVVKEKRKEKKQQKQKEKDTLADPFFFVFRQQLLEELGRAKSTESDENLMVVKEVGFF
jgi:hypothetical protein